MRFLLPEFASHQITTRAERREMARRQQAVRDAYTRHGAWLRATAPAPLADLQAMDLSDGRTRFLVWEPGAKRFRFSLHCGNGQTGYFDVTVCLGGVTLTRRDRDVLRLVARQKETADLAHWEVDCTETSETVPYVLRLQWHTLLVIRRWNEAGTPRPVQRRSRQRRRGTIETLAPEIAVGFSNLSFTVAARPNRAFTARGRRFLIVR